MSGENVTLDAENKKDAAVDQMKHDLGAGIRLQSGQAVGRQIQIPNSYIALDLETTGLNPKQDKIIEIGAVRVEAGQETGRFHTMLDPHRELETRITELTGITGDMLENAPDLVDILPGFLDFCGELPLLGHRIIFDYIKKGRDRHADDVPPFYAGRGEQTAGSSLCLLWSYTGERPPRTGRCIGCPQAVSEAGGEACRAGAGSICG